MPTPFEPPATHLLSVVDNGDGTYTANFDTAITVTSTDPPELGLAILSALNGWQGITWNTAHTATAQVFTPSDANPGATSAIVTGNWTKANATPPLETAIRELAIT